MRTYKPQQHKSNVLQKSHRAKKQVNSNKHLDGQSTQHNSTQLSSETILQLQRTIGNQAVQKLLQRNQSNDQNNNLTSLLTPTDNQQVVQLDRDQHGNGCRCSTCSRVQRTIDENGRVQRDGNVSDKLQREGEGIDYSPNDFQAILAMWKEKAQTKVAPVSGPHIDAPVYKGPDSATAVRSLVTSASPSGSGAAAFLAERVKELQGLGLSSEVDDVDALIPVLAADMKKKNDMKPPNEQQKNVDWMAAAKGQIEGNKTTALTTSDDKYTAIKGGVKFDELHEFIHICAAPGGESALMHFNLNMNEGAVNLFSELVAPLVGVNLVGRYPPMTNVVKALVASINAQGGDGLGLLYGATFKGEVDQFFDAVGDAYVKGDKKPNGKNKGFSDKKWDAPTAATTIKGYIQNWSYNNLKNAFL